MMKRILVFLLVVSLLVGIGTAADVTTLDPGTSTDWNLWVFAGVLGLILFLLSLNASSAPADVEIDAIISAIAWIPIAFCAYASFSVSRIVGTGYQTLYSMPTIGVLMMVFLVVAILNTVRIIALHKVLQGKNEVRND
jgi:hypothetical protein